MGDDSVNWVTWAPWNRYKDHGERDGDLPEGVPPEEKKENLEKGPGKIYIDVRSKVPMEFPIQKADGKKHGFTKGCGGCSSWFRGLGKQDHTEVCRERFRKLLKDEKRLKNYEERLKEFEEEQEAKKQRKWDKENKKIAKRLEREDKKMERERERG